MDPTTLASTSMGLPIAVSEYSRKNVNVDPDTFVYNRANELLHLDGDQLPPEEIPAMSIIFTRTEDQYITYTVPLFLLGGDKDLWAQITKTVLETVNGYGYILLSECWFTEVTEDRKEEYDKTMEEHGSLEFFSGREERLMANFFSTGKHNLIYRTIGPNRTLGPIETMRSNEGVEVGGRFADVVKPQD